MALLERVSTLIRANLNDLVDKAEDPEKMIKQVILDMENQLMQVKTQVAVALADQHVLESKRKENAARHEEWTRKAELAVDKGKDDLARAAIERALAHERLAENFAEQLADQRAQAEELKTALLKLEEKLTEARSMSEMLIAQHRRARALGKATDARAKAGGEASAAAFSRMRRKVEYSEAVSKARSEMLADSTEERLAALEKADQVEKRLAELKARKGQ